MKITFVISCLVLITSACVPKNPREEDGKTYVYWINTGGTVYSVEYIIENILKKDPEVYERFTCRDDCHLVKEKRLKRLVEKQQFEINVMITVMNVMFVIFIVIMSRFANFDLL